MFKKLKSFITNLYTIKENVRPVTNLIVLEEYRDYLEVGSWGAAKQNENGEWESIKDMGGKLFQETVKVRDEYGTVKLEKRWISDSEINGDKFD